jgi:hypothetical protein
MTSPFLLQFRGAIASGDDQVVMRRYDGDRSVSQVLEGGRWVDHVNARKQEPVPTRFTKVDRETTDDD